VNVKVAAVMDVLEIAEANVMAHVKELVDWAVLEVVLMPVFS
jgi:hypothetical protein